MTHPDPTTGDPTPRACRPRRAAPPTRRARPLAWAAPWALLFLASAWAPAASAQAGPSLGDAVTAWARGNWASPVFCRIGGETVRGIRRVLVEPARNPVPGRTELELRFVDMQVSDAERCFDLVGTEVPNLVGKLQLRFNGTSHPETVVRDFERALRRDRGFAFGVVRGHLRVEPVGPGEDAGRVEDFARGSAWLRVPAPSSDAERALADFRSPRKLELEISAPEGETIRLPLFLADDR